MNINAPLLIRLMLPALVAGTASAQTICDQISIDRIGYAPFGNGLEVVIHNGNDVFLSYPTVQLFNNMGDSLGSSALTFFGIMNNSSQLHQINATEQIPATPFSGSIVFNYFTENGFDGCTIPFNGLSLCPNETCIPLQVYTYFTPNVPEAVVTWTITDAEGVEAAQGTLDIDPDGVGSVANDLCIPAGHYTLRVQQSTGDAWSFPLGLVTPDWSIDDAVHGTLSTGEELAIDFSFFEPCMTIGQGVRPYEQHQANIWVVDRQLHIRTMDQQAVGAVRVLDATGRTVRDIAANHSTGTILEIGDLATGTYLVCSPSHAWTSQRIFVP